jgi:hypothetical protein
MINNNDKRKIANKVKSFTKEVHLEIFSFLESNNYSYTINNNGVFFNINNLNKQDLIKLKEMVDFYETNEENLKEAYINRFRVENT